MRRIAWGPFFISICLVSQSSQASIFGEETVVLLEVVANQLTELNRLAENVGIAKNQIELLKQINEGVERATYQIQSIQSILDRSQGVDPSSIRSLSDINQAIEDMKSVSSDIQELLVVKLFLCNQAIEEADLQSDTAYKMGQELAQTRSTTCGGVKNCKPGQSSADYRFRNDCTDDGFGSRASNDGPDVSAPSLQS